MNRADPHIAPTIYTFLARRQRQVLMYYVHCKKNPVKLTVKLLAAVLPTKNRKIYGQENDNRHFFYGK